MTAFDSIRADIGAYLSANYGIALETIAPDSTLQDVGFDSLGVLSVATMIENKYGLFLEDEQMQGLKTFGELMELLRVRSAELG